MNAEQRFDWPVCQEAEDYLLARIDAFLERQAFARELARRMADETGTLLLDWVDSLVLDTMASTELRSLGFVPDLTAETPAGREAWHHPEAMLPRVLLEDAHGPSSHELAIHVESLADFMG